MYSVDMVRRRWLVLPLFAVLGCGPGPATLDDASDETQDASDSSDDGESTTQPSMLDAESESTESESTESESTDGESTDGESTESESTESTTTGEPSCGDGRIAEDMEQCEGDDLDGFDCLALGYWGGTLACDPITCTFDASGCTLAGELCGNGSVEAEEDCDGAIGNTSCVDLGFVGGTLACNDPCLVDGESIGCLHDCEFDLTACLLPNETSPCVTEADCPANVPFCSNGECRDGAEGDPCLDADDCQPALDCKSNGECWNGSAGDECLSDADCTQNTGQCAFGRCYPGVWGSPCASQDDCQFNFFCAGSECTTL
jgi:hypothetical protein